jgi:hypothetical protein
MKNITNITLSFFKFVISVNGPRIRRRVEILRFVVILQVSHKKIIIESHDSDR